jgi:hypothetical protein
VVHRPHFGGKVSQRGLKWLRGAKGTFEGLQRPQGGAEVRDSQGSRSGQVVSGAR